MSGATRPKSHTERETIIRAMVARLTAPDADATVVELYARVFAEPSGAYQLARTAWLTAHGAWQAARRVAEEADEGFDGALRHVMLSLRAHDGREDADLNRSLLGGVAPYELMAMRYSEEITRGRALLTRLDARPDLHPDPERVARLSRALTALTAAAGDLEGAWLARLSAGRVQDQASRELDRAWGKLVRAMNALAPSVAAEIVPRFARGSGKTEADEPAP